jgi:hypothetical protein
MVCGNCGADQVRKLALVFEERSALADASATSIAPGARTGRADVRDRDTVEAIARVAPPSPRNVDRGISCIAVFGVVGIAWHVLWIAAGIFLALAVNDASWNYSVWRKLYAAWNERYLCDRCGWIGTPAPDGGDATHAGGDNAAG